MHPVDLMIFICIGNCVGWLTGMYAANALRGLIGHVAIGTIGAFLAGNASLILLPDFGKSGMIIAAIVGAALLVHLVHLSRLRMRH